MSMQTANTAVKAPASKFSIGFNSILFGLLVVLGLVLFNYVASRVYKRADLTDDKLYTLSDAYKQLVKNLQRPLHVKLFVSEKLLPGYRETAQYIEDLLDEYKNASNGKFHWEVIHPEAKDEYRKEADRYGIKPFVARAKSATALEARTITFGMAISYKKPGKDEKTEVLPRLFPGVERNIEYVISERIKRLTVHRKKILVMTGHNEFPMQQQAKIKDYLQQMFSQYTVETYSLKGKSDLPDNADMILVMTPQTPYSKEEVAKINRWLMKGKAALFMLDGMVRQRRQMMMQNRMPPIFMGAKNGLEDLLKNWGVTINQDIVMDHQLQLFPVGKRVIFHPAIPAIRVPGMKATVTPFLASSISVNKAYLGKKTDKPFHILPLLSTTAKAWTQKPPFIFNIQVKPKPPAGTKLEAYLIGVAVEGTLPSLPEDASAKKDAKDAKKDATPKQSLKTARVVVIGDADMLWLSRQMPPNMLYLQNIMDWLAQDETLVKLRNKMAQDRTLDLPDDRSTIVLIKTANMLGLPLLVLLAGFVLWAKRRSSRRRAKV